MKVSTATRIRPALIHFLISFTIAVLAALVVFKLWFPAPYDDMAGGSKLFVILVSVDVVLGPLLTFVAFNPSKTRRHLAMDLSVIALLQMAALAYGLHTMASARPVVLAAENMMFRVVVANGVKVDELPLALPDFRSLSWTGPRLVGVRRSASGAEMMQSVNIALQGYDVGSRPSYWQSYEQTRQQVIRQATPLAPMAEASPWHREAVDTAVQSVGRPVGEVSVLPVLTRKTGWYALLDRQTGDVLGFARLDPGAP